MTDTCVQIVGGRNSNVLLNGFRYSKCKVNKNGSVIWSCRVPGCKCKLTSGADLNVIRNPCPDHTYSTDTDSTAVALLVNSMRKRAREKILPIPQIYEQERRKMLITGLDVAPADISTASQTIQQFSFTIVQTTSVSYTVRAIRIHSLVQYETTTVVFDRSDCNDFIF